MECTFVTGDKIAVKWGCDTWLMPGTRTVLPPGPWIPKHGVVYTVESVFARGELIGVYLVEMDASFSYDHRAFRKVDYDELRLLRRVKAPLPPSKVDVRPRETEDA